MMIMEKPYTKAFFTPCARDLALPVKKVTVMGIIGNTQGVSNAATPPRKAKTIKPNMEALSLSPDASCAIRSEGSVVPVLVRVDSTLILEDARHTTTYSSH